MVGDVDEVDRGHAGGCALLAIGADPADMGAVAESHHAGPRLTSAGDRTAHRLRRHRLAEATPGVEHEDGAAVAHRLDLLVGHEQAQLQDAHIGRDHADTVRVVTGEVGAHEVTGHLVGLVLAAAHRPHDREGE